MEKEKPPKDTSFVYTEKLSCYKERPQAGANFLLRRNLEALIPKLLQNINEFTHSNFIKYRGLCQLSNTIVIVEGAIEPYLENILKVLGRFLSYDDPQIENQVRICARILGAYIDCDVYIPLLINLISDEEAKEALKYLNSLLVLFSIMIRAENPKTIEDNLERIVRCLTLLENAHEDNEEILESLYLIDKQLIISAGENSAIYCRELFSILLTVSATTQFGQSNKQLVDEAMQSLARVCGYPSIAELHANEVSILLDEFAKDQSYVRWNKQSRERQKFNVIVRNCKEGVARFMPLILQILHSVANPENDVEMRMDALLLVEFLIEQERLVAVLKENALQILSKILIPSIVWRVGKPESRIRKAGVINCYKLIERQLIAPEELSKCLKELIPPIKTCLEDDWSPDLRYAACVLAERTLLHAREFVDYEHIHDLYPALLERLDDSQDTIRTEITKSFIVLFGCKGLHESSSIFEYIVKALFVHLDDQNEDIEHAIFNCLKYAVKFDAKRVKDEALVVEGKMKYPRKCTELINLCDEKLTENSDAESHNEMSQ